jgi:hypothetical protein
MVPAPSHLLHDHRRVLGGADGPLVLVQAVAGGGATLHNHEFTLIHALAQQGDPRHRWITRTHQHGCNGSGGGVRGRRIGRPSFTNSQCVGGRAAGPQLGPVRTLRLWRKQPRRAAWRHPLPVLLHKWVQGPCHCSVKAMPLRPEPQRSTLLGSASPSPLLPALAGWSAATCSHPRHLVTQHAGHTPWAGRAGTQQWQPGRQRRPPPPQPPLGTRCQSPKASAGRQLGRGSNPLRQLLQPGSRRRVLTLPRAPTPICRGIRPSQQRCRTRCPAPLCGRGHGHIHGVLIGTTHGPRGRRSRAPGRKHVARGAGHALPRSQQQE